MRLSPFDTEASNGPVVPIPKEGFWKEAVVTYVKVLSRNSPLETE